MVHTHWVWTICAYFVTRCLAVPQFGNKYRMVPPLLFMLHIGKLIEEELRRQERTVSWFARKLFCDRTNVYDIFQRKSIDTELLMRISIVLDYDFFKHYTETMKGKEEV